MKSKQITQEDFDRLLENIISNQTGAQLLSIPGIYETVSEFFNNEVIETWEESRYQEAQESGVYEVYDNGGKTADRFTVIFDDDSCYFMSSDANMPNGVCMYAGEPGSFAPMGEEIEYSDLPPGTKAAIANLRKF